MADLDDDLDQDELNQLLQQTQPSPLPVPQTAPNSQPGALQPAPTAQPANPVSAAIAAKYGFAPGTDQAALQSAQTSAGKGTLIANLGGALASITHGLSGQSGQVDQAPYQAIADQAQAPVKNILQLRQGQLAEQDLKNKQMLEDPTSMKSQVFQNMIKRLYPKDMADSDVKLLSAADAPQAMDILKLKETIEGRKDAAMLARQSKMEGTDNKRYTSLGDALDENKGRAGEFGRQVQFVNNADRVLQLAKQFPDLNLPPAQMGELASASASLIGGGSGAAEGTINRFVPKTLAGSAAGLAQWLTSEPHGAGQQAFVKQMMDTAQRERDLAASKLQAVKMSRVAQYSDLSTKDPAKFNAVLESHGIDPAQYADYQKNGYKAPTPTKPTTNPSPDGLEDEMRKRGLLK